MSVITETFLTCNDNCGNMFGVDDRYKSGKQQREAAKKVGWSKHGKYDYCPTHTEKRRLAKSTKPTNDTNG